MKNLTTVDFSTMPCQRLSNKSEYKKNLKSCQNQVRVPHDSPPKSESQEVMKEGFLRMSTW